MAQELEQLEQVVDEHMHDRLTPDEWKEASDKAEAIRRRCETSKAPYPLPVKQWLDRTAGPKHVSDMIGRDVYGRDYARLTQPEQLSVQELHVRHWTDADGTSNYLKRGVTFGAAFEIRREALRAVATSRYQQEIKSGLADFARAIEHGLDAAAKRLGFYQQYSAADKALRMSVAGPHRATQNFPIQVKETTSGNK